MSDDTTERLRPRSYVEAVTAMFNGPDAVEQQRLVSARAAQRAEFAHQMDMAAIQRRGASAAARAEHRAVLRGVRERDAAVRLFQQQVIAVLLVVLVVVLPAAIACTAWALSTGAVWR